MAEDLPETGEQFGPPTDLREPVDAAAAQTQRFAKQRQHSILNAAVDIASDEEYEALEPGTRFMGPDRKQRVKPFEVKSDEDYDLVPEGAQFVDPDGKTRMKPRSEGIGFSADTLYEMARTPETRRQALKLFYPEDKIKQDTRGEFYIDDDGKTRRPGRGVSGFAGGIAAEAAPSVGMMLGGHIGTEAGGVAGTFVEPGGGTVLGALGGGTGGAILGAMAGRQFNNVVLGLAGIHETLPEQVKSLASEAAGVGGGELLGRGLTKVPAALAATSRKTGAVRDTASNLRANLPQALEQLGVTPERARKFLGTPLETAQRASDIVQEIPPAKTRTVDFDPLFEPHGGAEPYEAAQFLEDISPTRQQEPGRLRQVYIPGRGMTHVMVPPSVYAPEAPMLKKIEEFDRIFRSQDVVAQSWEALYNQQVPRILADAGIGVSLEELATRATKKVSSEKAGQLSLAAARRDMAIDDAALENARRDAIALARRPVDQLGGEEAAKKFQQEGLERLQAAHARAQETATRYIQAAAEDLRRDIDTSIKMAAGGEDTGDLNKAIAAKYQAWNVAIRQRASTMYDAANDAAGGARIDVAGLSEEANAFLQSLPEQVRQKYPGEIAKLAQIARAMEEGPGQFEATGIDIVGELGSKNEPVDTTMSFADLHKLRSWFRYGIDYQDMTPDMKGGSLKFFEKKIDDLLHTARDDVKNENTTIPANIGAIDPNAKLDLGTLYRGVEGGTDRLTALRHFPGGDLGDGIYFTQSEKLASSYGGGPTASVKKGTRAVHRYELKAPLYPDEVAYLFGGLREGDDAVLVSGTGIELWRGEWSGENLENALRKHEGVKVVVGTPDSVGVNQIAVKDRSVLKSELDRGGQSKKEGDLRVAAELLDQADAFYKANVPFLKDKMVQGTIDMLESGEGANPEALARMFFVPERTASMRRARGIVGENLWKGVQAADVQHMLDASRMVGSQDIDGAKFAQQVEQRLRDGILETGYDAALARRVQKIVTDTKKLAGQLRITSDPGDTISTLMRRIEIAQQEADKFAELDPLAALKKATSEIQIRFNKTMEAARKTRRQEPLHHLTEESQSHLAVRAADKILGSQDLIMAAATKFGRDSPEFNALRQVYAQRFFQREFPKTAAMRAELGGEKGMTEEVQALMFPGITRDQMVTLAKNMEFLFSAGGTDVGGALAAANRVLHPEANFPLSGKAIKYVMMVPGAGAAMRFTLGKFYALAMDATTHPNFINWLANRLEGDAFARAQARAAIQQRIKMGALLGRGFGQQMLAPQQGNQQQEQPESVQ